MGQGYCCTGQLNAWLQVARPRQLQAIKLVHLHGIFSIKGLAKSRMIQETTIARKNRKLYATLALRFMHCLLTLVHVQQAQ